jgi:hypothetical protein
MGACQSSEPLYVILPYFNSCGYKRRHQLFVDFVASLKHKRGIRLVVSESLGPEPLPELDVWLHVKTPAPRRPLWVKENLVNIAVSKLPEAWKYMAWVDADITFLNDNWVEDTIAELAKHDVVQLFQTAVNLGPRGESLKIDKGFGYMHKGSGTPWTPTDKYGFWHPGYAWACRRSAYRAMGGLIDWAILGSADRHMSMAWIGKALESAPGTIHGNYKELLRDYQLSCRGFKISYVEGTILHYWHGRFEDRRYKERWEILTRHGFDPLVDIAVGPSGSLQLAQPGLRMAEDLEKYFLGRKEDLV